MSTKIAKMKKTKYKKSKDLKTKNLRPRREEEVEVPKSKVLSQELEFPIKTPAATIYPIEIKAQVLLICKKIISIRKKKVKMMKVLEENH